MILNPREQFLAWLTGMVVLFLATWRFYAQPRFDRLSALAEAREKVEAALRRERLVLQREQQVREQFQAAYQDLATFPEAMDVTADMLIKVEGLANSNQLVLTRREPQKERRQGDIATLDIKCNWDGTLESLVRFLYALGQDHAMLDISELYIRAEGKGVLKGTFTINCSYIRKRAAETPSPPPPSVPTPESPQRQESA